MVRGLLAGSAGGGDIWYRTVIVYFPVSGSEADAQSENDAVIARPLPRKVLKDRSKWPVWHWCRPCRLLHYPEPTP